MAVPTVAGVAAAACLAPQAAAAPAAHAAVKDNNTISDARGHAGLSPVQLVAALQPAKGRHAAASERATYTVRSGDSLSAIAGRVYHKQEAWPVLYWANRDQIRWANLIEAGQVLKVPAMPANIPAAPGQLAPAAPAPAPAPAAATAEAPVSQASEAPVSEAPVSQPAQSTATTASGSYSGGSSFQQCVIARESGGNAQVMNSTGHYGLYQFSASTWAAYGGNPADFGHASVSEQNKVFSTAVAQGGQSNWSPYDGC